MVRPCSAQTRRLPGCQLAYAETNCSQVSSFKEQVMKQVQSYIAVLCAMLVAAPPIFSQQNSGQDSRGPQLDTERPHWYSGITQPYQSRAVPPVNVSNSSRIDALLRAGNLYLSLSDAIALALENN